jgi:hypothetical protein
VAQAFFVSLSLGIFTAYPLNPLVVYLERLRIPRRASTVAVMAGLTDAAGASTTPERLAPHVANVKVVSERVEQLQPVAGLPGNWKTQ